MRVLLRILFLLIVLGLLAYLIGHAIPAAQTHVRSITLKQTPEAVFKLLTDLPNMPKWNRNLVKIEMLPAIDGRETSRQTFKGDMQMTVITTESRPPRHLVRTVADTRGTFSGSWSYEIAPHADGCEIVLTEKAETRSALFRFLARIFGPTKYMDEHLADIAKHFGETPAVR